MEEVKEFLRNIIKDSEGSATKSGSTYTYYFNLGRVSVCHEPLHFIAQKEAQATEQKKREESGESSGENDYDSEQDR